MIAKAAKSDDVNASLEEIDLFKRRGNATEEGNVVPTVPGLDARYGVALDLVPGVAWT